MGGMQLIKKLYKFIIYILSIVLDRKLLLLFNRILNNIHSIHLTKLLKSKNKINAEYEILIEGDPSFIIVGENFTIRKGTWIGVYNQHMSSSFNPKLIIGDNVHINFNSHIACINEINIGDNTLIASRVLITDHYHGDTDIDSLEIIPIKRELISPGKVIIGKNVLIGENVSILPNVVIGDNAVIGANSVVTKDIPPYGVYAGNPAKNLKEKKHESTGIL